MRKDKSKMYRDEKWLTKQCAGMKVRDIAQECGVSKATIRNWKRHFGLKRETNMCRVNASYFKKIDTAEKAYWLGFLSADGCVQNENNKRVSLVLTERDKAHVELFRQHIGSTHAVVYRPPTNRTIRGKEYLCSACYGVHVYSKDMVSDLINNGVIPRKTNSLKSPKLNKALVRHWIRGYFDGDGSISIGSNGQRLGNVEGTKSVVEFIHKYCPVFGKPYYQSKYNIWISAFCGNRNAIKLAKYLYNSDKESIICLERKRIKF